jgi:hypothetical protein
VYLTCKIYNIADAKSSAANGDEQAVLLVLRRVDNDHFDVGVCCTGVAARFFHHVEVFYYEERKKKECCGESVHFGIILISFLLNCKIFIILINMKTHNNVGGSSSTSRV